VLNEITSILAAKVWTQPPTANNALHNEHHICVQEPNYKLAAFYTQNKCKLKTRGSVKRMFISVKQNTWQQ
jgi:fatty acid desaturase